MIPIAAGHLVTSCSTAPSLGRRLQVIDTVDLRDHVPLVVTLDYQLHFCGGKCEQRTKLDGDAIARCLHYGIGRAEFLERVEQASFAHAQRLEKNGVAEKYADDEWG
eukprot:3596844-Alexandrium_andersonii.AAC.1